MARTERAWPLGLWLSLALGVVGACALRGPTETTSSSTSATSAMPSGQGGAVASLVSSTVASGAGLVPNVPPSFEVMGRVIDQDGNPLAKAFVLQGGRSHEPAIETTADGAFTLTMTYLGLGTPTVVASLRGYRTAGLEVLEVPSEPIELALTAATPPDNESYAYGAPGKGKDPSTAFCGHCHDTIAAEFQTSKHAQAARDPLVHDLYAGTASGFTTKVACDAAGGTWRTGHAPGTASDAALKCYVGGGVLPAINPSCGVKASLACDDPALSAADRPTEFGGCADCHAPGMSGKAGGRDLLDATEIAYENGVHCDFCHKVADVDLALPPGTAGRLRVQRPHETFQSGPPGGKVRQVMFGPLLDVPNPNMGGSLQPQFATATFCAGCHEALQPALVPGTTLAPRFAAGLPVHTTYTEWLASPYAKGGVPCQHCHMPPNDALDSSADLGNAETASITFGFPRPSDQIRRHIFRGPLVSLSPQSLRLIDSALTSSVKATFTAGQLDVDVSVANLGCGHAVPTGDPMRVIVMLVEAQCNGVPLEANGGLTVDDGGGAKAQTTLGSGVSLAGMNLTWAAATGIANAGDVVRLVRPSGAFHDYDGVGLFAGGALLASEKGIPIALPVGLATVLAVTPTGLTLDRSLPGLNGDVLYLGDATATLDGQTSRALAGAPGLVYARVLVDGQGSRHVPHFRGTDIASDNRIAPTKVQHSAYRFALPSSCKQTTATVQATLLYRPLPHGEARLRGWDAHDYRIGTSADAIAIP